MRKFLVCSMLSILLSPDAAEGGSVAETAPATPTTPEVEEEEKKEEEKEEVIATIDEVNYVKKEYREGRSGENYLAGWGFATPRFRDETQFITHVDEVLKKLNKYDEKNKVTGRDIILELIHTAIDSKLRVRVKAGEPDFKGKTVEAEAYYIKKSSENAQKVLFTAEEAHNWVPGVRELSGMALTKSLLEQVKELLKSGKSATDPEVAELLQNIALGLK